jgi:hypothetical protein
VDRKSSCGRVIRRGRVGVRAGVGETIEAGDREIGQKTDNRTKKSRKKTPAFQGLQVPIEFRISRAKLIADRRRRGRTAAAARTESTSGTAEGSFLISPFDSSTFWSPIGSVAVLTGSIFKSCFPSKVERMEPQAGVVKIRGSNWMADAPLLNPRGIRPIDAGLTGRSIQLTKLLITWASSTPVRRKSSP